jgi:hypothetical protein
VLPKQLTSSFIPLWFNADLNRNGCAVIAGERWLGHRCVQHVGWHYDVQGSQSADQPKSDESRELA